MRPRGCRATRPPTAQRGCRVVEFGAAEDGRSSDRSQRSTCTIVDTTVYCPVGFVPIIVNFVVLLGKTFMCPAPGSYARFPQFTLRIAAHAAHDMRMVVLLTARMSAKSGWAETGVRRCPAAGRGAIGLRAVPRDPAFLRTCATPTTATGSRATQTRDYEEMRELVQEREDCCLCRLSDPAQHSSSSVRSRRRNPAFSPADFGDIRR